VEERRAGVYSASVSGQRPAQLVSSGSEDCAGAHAQGSGIMLEIQSRDAPAAPAGLKGARMRRGGSVKEASRVAAADWKSDAGKRGGFGGDARAGSRGAGARRDTKNK
jgi:hypothetical protein